MVLELVRWDAEAVDEFLRGDLRLTLVAARGEQVREQRLQDGEALRGDWSRRTLGRAVADSPLRLGGDSRRVAGVDLADLPQRVGDGATQFVRLDRNRAPVLSQHPRRELTQPRVVALEQLRPGRR